MSILQLKTECYCADPIEAVNRANEVKPTVILQDLVMPKIDDLSVVRLFRANPSTAATPITVLSGSEDSDTKGARSSPSAPTTSS